MDPMILQMLAMGAVELLLLPIIVFVIKKVIGKKLDLFDEKRELARSEQQKRHNDNSKWQDSVTTAIRSLLRAEIVDAHSKWIDLGYCPLESKEYLRRCHNAYVGVGGNDIGDALFSEIMALPNQSKGYNSHD